MHHGVGHHYFAFIASVFISLEVVFNAMGQTLGVIVAWLVVTLVHNTSLYVAYL